MLQPVPLIRRGLFQHCASTLDELGLNTDAIISRAGIQNWQYGAADQLVPFHDFLDALEVGADAVGDQCFGLLVGEQHNWEFGKFGRVIARSASLYDACKESARLVNLINTSSRMWVTKRHDGILYCRSKAPSWQMELYVLSQMVGLVRLVEGKHWRPSEVYLSSPRTNGLHTRETFADSKIRTGQPFLAVFIPNHLLGRETGLNRVFGEPIAQQGLNWSIADDDFAGSISQIIDSLLPDQNVGLEVVCEILGFSKRTLQRELNDEGVYYRDLVGRARFRRACELLRNSDETLQNIAHEVGYSSHTQFIRAFKTWAGTTPGYYRELHTL